MYELQVEGMTCNHCVAAVTKSVKEIDDGAKVDVDLATHKVRVDSKASIDDIKSAVADAGYEVASSRAV
ncbi:MAG: copper-binding protein [Burkholderiales bacterium RIFCSPLOWO2_02_FULL_57_36]|nr:MAG: copper-binding protein [Burkholderiales bacterium RIFCSPLOWO2_02_FULL_57_36]